MGEFKNPITPESARRLGMEYFMAGLIEPVGKEMKPTPTLKGILFINFVLSQWPLVDLFALLAQQIQTGVAAAETDNAVSRIMRDLATGMETARKTGAGDGEGSGGEG